MDQFQNRLPKVVIKAGRVIDIRGSLRDTLQVRNCPSFLSVLCGTCAQYYHFLTHASNRVHVRPRAAVQ